jgi:hypothetical protein
VIPPAGDQIDLVIGLGIAVGVGTWVGTRQRPGSARRAIAYGVLTAAVKLVLVTLAVPFPDWFGPVADAVALVAIVGILGNVLWRTIEDVRQDPRTPR